jgi:hypothetical protein
MKQKTNAENKRGRSDRPSGRQAAVQPEHSGKEDRDVSTLHQGQGPDFMTQDSKAQKQNEGVQQLKDLNGQHKRNRQGHMDGKQLASRDRKDKPDESARETPGKQKS